MTTDLYEPPAGGAAPPTDASRLWLTFAAGIVVGALAVGTVVSLRQDTTGVATQPLPTPSGADAARPPVLPTDVVDWQGYGLLRLGMAASDYRSLLTTASDAGDSDAGIDIQQVSVDRVHDCIQYAVMAPAFGPDTWAWVRDDRLVALGVPYSRDLATSFGPALGDPAGLDANAAGSDRWRGWRLDTEAPVFVMRRTQDGVVATMIDGNDDGTLDGVAVATADGEQCRPEPEPDMGYTPPLDGPTIVGTTLSGATLGMTAAEFAAVPQWRDGATEADVTCRQVSFRDGRRAWVDGTVVALAAPEVLDGPVLGQTVDEIMRRNDSADLTWMADVYRGRADAALVLPDGRQFLISGSVAPVIPDGLDYPVSLPERDVAQRVVTSITLGEPC